MKRTDKLSISLQLLFVTVVAFAIAQPAYAQKDQGGRCEASNHEISQRDRPKCTQGALRLIGEQWTRTQPRAEILAALARWFNAKGGAALSRELVMQRTMTEEQAHAMVPTSTSKGNVYYFRYRSKYPGGTFFEDIYIGTDSNGVLRVEGHLPQPA